MHHQKYPTSFTSLVNPGAKSSFTGTTLSFLNLKVGKKQLQLSLRCTAHLCSPPAPGFSWQGRADRKAQRNRGFAWVQKTLAVPCCSPSPEPKNQVHVMQNESPFPAPHPCAPIQLFQLYHTVWASCKVLYQVQKIWTQGNRLTEFIPTPWNTR